MATGSPSRTTSLIGVLLLAAAAVAVFASARTFDSLLYDDDKYVFDNPVVREGLTAHGAAWAVGFREGTWQPLTWVSHMADVSAFGLAPGPMHLHNLVLHLLVGLLVWRVLARATGRPLAAFAAALLFLLHPLQAQSVAWIAERKGLLAALLGLLALDGWTDWARGASRGGLVRAHLFFALSLAAKPILLPLPVVLLAWDRWPYGRPTAWRDKLGLLALSVAGGVTAVLAQRSAGALRSLEGAGVLLRVESAVTAWGHTLRRFVAPYDLAGFYPFRDDVSAMAAAGWAALLVAGTVLAWRLRFRRPVLLAGWTWWLLLQAPTVGLLQFGAQAEADRFSYVPLAGLLVIVVFGMDWGALRARSGKAVPVVLAVAAAVVLGLLAHRAAQPWRDTVTLFEYSIARAGDSAVARQNLSIAWTRKGNVAAARRHSDRAVALAPREPLVLFQQADLRFAVRDFAGAAEFYRRGLTFAPNHAPAWAQLAASLERTGDRRGAQQAMQRARELSR